MGFFCAPIGITALHLPLSQSPPLVERDVEDPPCVVDGPIEVEVAAGVEDAIGIAQAVCLAAVILAHGLGVAGGA